MFKKIIKNLIQKGFYVYKKEEKERYYVCKDGYRGVVLIDLSNNKPSFDIACKVANIVHFRSYNIAQKDVSVKAIEKMLQYKFKDRGELSSPRDVLNIKYLGLKPFRMSN